MDLIRLECRALIDRSNKEEEGEGSIAEVGALRLDEVDADVDDDAEDDGGNISFDEVLEAVLASGGGAEDVLMEVEIYCFDVETFDLVLCGDFTCSF